MTDRRPTREEREQQLFQMLQSEKGRRELDALYRECSPVGQVPPAGNFVVLTILDREYGKPK